MTAFFISSLSVKPLNHNYRVGAFNNFQLLVPKQVAAEKEKLKCLQSRHLDILTARGIKIESQQESTFPVETLKSHFSLQIFIAWRGW
jgi:hypothetical protein